MTMGSTGGRPRAGYRFGFILSTSLGNLTRYQILRKFAERDPDVEFVWAPVKQFIGPGEHNPFRYLPRALRTRAIVFYQSAPVLRRFRSLDAVMIHMYEVDILTALWGYFRKSPVRIISTDDAPVIDPATYPLHQVDRMKPAWRLAIRLWIDLWRVRRADLLVPFSKWAGDLTVQAAGISPDLVTPVHVGLDLEYWRPPPLPGRTTAANRRAKVLFVGGDFVRKGGAHLLEAFERHLKDAIELHLVTKSAPPSVPDNVYVYSDLSVDDHRLRDLYQQVDLLAHPTTADLSSWVVLEAMATGLPAVVTPVGGIIDLVDDGKTGIFVPVGDVDALAAAIRSLVEAPETRRQMGERARKSVEQNFDAAVNVPRILGLMKSAVDSRANRRVTPAPN